MAFTRSHNDAGTWKSYLLGKKEFRLIALKICPLASDILVVLDREEGFQ